MNTPSQRPDEPESSALRADLWPGSMRSRRPSDVFEPTTDEEGTSDPRWAALQAEAPSWGARAGRRNLLEKFWAGLNGIKHAIRGDSSFFAHGYRCVLVAVAAGMMGVDANSWCLLLIAACFVFTSEFTHSAVDTLARAVGDPEAPQLKIAREIAAGGVFIAVLCAATIATVVLVLRFNDLIAGH